MANQKNHNFEKVYYEYAALVIRYLLSIGCPPQDVEDITQDTFVKALLNIDSFRGECKLSVWLCQIARNTWLTQLKKQKRDVPLELTEKGVHDDHFCEWLDLVERLEEPYRTVFFKKAVCDWSYEELAQKYGKSESWARVTFYRARLQMQELLNGRRK